MRTKMIFQKLTSFGVLFTILVIAVTSGILAEEFSFATNSITSNLPEDDFLISSPVGHVEDVSFGKLVSSTGTIAINQITFTVVSDDPTVHSFQICAVIEGPSETFSPSIGDKPSCTNTEIDGNGIFTNQSIDFSNPVNVNDVVGISISVKEI